MKRALALFLAMLLLAPTALAAEEAFPYRTSDWARAEVGQAAELGLIYDPYGHFSDLRSPITRGDFASNAAALVAKGFGKDLEGYVLIMRYRGQTKDPAFTYSATDAAADLGILQGRGDGTQDYDRDAHITRQEAAAMLARTYRACQSAEPDVLEPVAFTDQEDIAGWALEDVALMNQLGIPYINCHSVGTIIHMAVNGTYAGHIVISDVVKPHSKEAVQALKAAGVRQTVMLTGDARKVADQVASELGLDSVYSELLPEDKVNKVEELLKNKPENAKLAFVGDGINDAPVLGRADIGIAMGAMGSDAAIEAADVVLMDDDPLKIAKAIRISRKCLRIVYQNIIFAIGIKLICLVLGAMGIANMWLAIFADVGVMIIAVLNAIRALFVKKL